MKRFTTQNHNNSIFQIGLRALALFSFAFLFSFTLAANPCDGLGGDKDEDGICDNVDNCLDTYNPSQSDYDMDGIGDDCDYDHDCGVTSIRRVLNLSSACSGAADRVVWVEGAYCKEIGDLYFTEYPDGTATLKGHLQEVDGGNISIVDVYFSGKSYTEGEPYLECASADNSGDWYYYQNFSGTIGGMQVVPNPLHNFQIGFGANVKNNTYGASGWFKLDGQSADFNFDLGEPLTIADNDNDGICNSQDNCEDTHNPVQADYDNDGIGDVCDDAHDCTDILSIRRVQNLASSCSGNDGRVIWFNGALCKEIGDLYFTEYTNGTAKLEGRIQEVDGNQINIVDVTFTDRSSNGTPYYGCADQSQSGDWYYYGDFSGTIGGMHVVPNPNHNFQVGFGANVKNDLYGASGWFTLDGTASDFNFDLGEALDCTPTSCSGEITGFQIFDAPSDGANTLIEYSPTATYCETQFNTDIKIRAAATGDHESLEFTISGPNGLHLTNTENYVNYDSKQFWATPGTYTITAKLYKGADLGGTLCDEQTITLVIKETCGPDVGDKVFYDYNKNGIQDNGENGVENVTVNLISAGDDGLFHTADDEVTGTKTTDENGNYLFAGVEPGTYCLEFDAETLPNRYGFSYQGEGSDESLDSDVTLDGKTEPFTIVDGQDDNLDFDAGIFKQGSIGNRVWFDDNMDGIQDDNETGVEGVLVKLISAGDDGTFHTEDDEEVASKLTGSTGYYRFGDVEPGTYCLEFDRSTLPANYGFTLEAQGTSASKDSDVSKDGKTAPFTVTAGDPDNLNFDAGIFEQGSIGSKVWHDTNANGILDNNEEGIPGVFVFLEDEFGNELTQYMYQYTDANGMYLFESLPLGKYVIRFATPSGYILTLPNQGEDDGLDSDADLIEGKSDVIMLTSTNPEDLSIDAGYYQPIDLPVELVRFDAAKNSCFTDLTWVSATEENFSHYEVEWSSSRSGFVQIGYVRGTSNGGTQYYSLTHENTSNTNYYRLKMVDLDGTFEYSDVINVTHDCNDAYGMTVFPNLVEQWDAEVSIKFYTEEDKASIYIVDGMGKMIRQFNPEIASMEWNLVDLDVTNLASGVYYIMIEGNRKAGKFIVQE